jgi:CHRD domain-containing protein
MRQLPILSMACAVMLAVPTVMADDSRSIKADLNGFNEPPALSTPATGSFKAHIRDEDSIEYELSYADLESDITQSHIHLGIPGVNGGISAWLCQGTILGPAGTPNCAGARTGGASGVITAASVIGPAGQGIAPGEFAELLRAIRAGATYANVHTVGRPGGEIRGKLE